MKFISVVILLVFVSFGTASATSLQLDFSATGFVDIQSGGPRTVPLDPVLGSITYEAVGSVITSLTGIDMTIDGYSYAIDDIAFLDEGSGNFSFYHTDSGVNVNSVRVNDFFLRVKYIVPAQLNLTPYGGAPYMMYAVESDRGIYDNWSDRTGTYTVGEVGASPVPEPATVILLGSGLVGLACYGRKRKKA